MGGMKIGKHPNMPGHKVENTGKLLGRVMAYVGKKYKFHLIVVVIGIFVSVLANFQCKGCRQDSGYGQWSY